MDKSQELAVSQMRKSVEKLGVSTEKYRDPTLMRFLIARSMDTDKAAKMFVQWQKWRNALVPLGSVTDSEVQDELEAKKIYLQGLSKKGFPIMIVKGSKHFPSNDQTQFKKFVVHILDKTIASSFKGREIGDEKLIGILDLKDLTYKNVDARALITGFQFVQAYYPECLAKCYIVHMPRFFVSIWRIVSYFLEKATLEKIKIVNNEEERRELVKDIGEEALPEEYGGQAKLVPIQDVVLPPLNH
ncbi:hypothetical protein ACH5RR_029827 [Cinchona calisaya]|uniref:CRAL-TRIO domain-containing protein n=1 Tax=Cinchona calisaya TaxID=153742 RepID=A0ABD2YSS5_9GENT